MSKSRLKISILFWFISLIVAEAHDSKVAYFDIQVINENVVIQAEFPWTIRNALLTYEPQVQDSLNKEFWQQSFRKYVDASLVLFDEKGHQLRLINVEQINTQGHSHQVNYTFTYSGSHLNEITNTFMFNISDKQTNYHTIKNGTESISLITKKENPTIRLKTVSDNNYFILIVPILILVFFLVKANSRKEAKH